MRVVSLVPSATEALCLIGGRGMLVGRSHECDFPPGLDAVRVVTRQALPQGLDPARIDARVREAVLADRPLYTLDAAALADLRPDVILTQDLCRVCSIDGASVREVARALPGTPRVVSLNPRTIEDVLDDLLRVGGAAGLADRAAAEVVALRDRMHRAMDFVNPFADGPSVALLEWTDPLYVGGHWTPQLIERAGGRCPLNPTVPAPDAGDARGPMHAFRRAGPSLRITPDALAASRPEFLIICPCGIPLAPAHEPTPIPLPARGPGVPTGPAGSPSHATASRTRPGHDVRTYAGRLALEPWFRNLPAARSGRVALVDGTQMFSRPGPRLINALEWLVAWLNDRPDVAPHDFPWEAFHGSDVNGTTSSGAA